MYKVIGADGKEYGPVSAELLKQWIAEGRANAGTQVRAEGATEWKPLWDLPEFQPLLSPTIPPTILAAAAAAEPPRTNPLATTGLVLGIVSITVGLCCCNGMPFSVAGIICSIIALMQINKDPNQRGKGLAIAGLVISILSLLLAIGLLIFAGAATTFSDLMRQFPR